MTKWTQFAEQDFDPRAKATNRHEGRGTVGGGSTFAQALSEHGLVDEYRLTVHPVALGRGLSLFGELPEMLVFDLVEAHRWVALCKLAA